MRTPKTLFLIVLFLSIVLFQNCRPVDSNRLQEGTSTGNPMIGKTVRLSFSSFNSQALNAEMCLSNILLRFSSGELESNDEVVDLRNALSENGFDLSYLYFDPPTQKYFINGIFRKSIQLDPEGTFIAELKIPSASYDQVVFGFSKCNATADSGIRIQNNHGAFSDDQFFALAYDNERTFTRLSDSVFEIDYFTDTLAPISSNVELNAALLPYRRFELLGLASTIIPEHVSLRMDSMAVQSTGKTVAIGYGYAFNESRTLVARYTADGVLDSSFASGVPAASVNVNGVIVPGVLSVSTHSIYTRGSSVAVAPDDSIFVFSNYYTGGREPFGILKILPEGSIDTTFGQNGWAIASFKNVHAYAHDITLLPDGSIIAVGSSRDYSLIAAKFTPSGQLDTQFGSNGFASIPYVPWGEDDKVCVGIQSDGKIILGGTIQRLDVTDENWIILRLTSNGSLDSTFNSGSSTPGKLLVNFTSTQETFLNDLIVLPDNKIVAIGKNPGTAGHDFAVTRISADGIFDSTFSQDGKAIFDFGGDDIPRNVVLGQTGQLLISGETKINDIFSFTLLSLNENGSVDTTVSPSGTRRFIMDGPTLGGIMAARENGLLSIMGNDAISLHLLTLTP